ncbi:Receptor-like protein kinase FERONIA [Bienertia sinuspersici]
MGRIFAVILWLSVLVNVIVAQKYTPKDNILLNCGASDPQSTDTDGRKWNSDVGSKFLKSSKGSSTAKAATQSPEVGEVPYLSARIFESNFTYSIAVAPGRKFVRLHFYPSSYSNLNSSNAIFSVTAGSFTLLSNFSATQTTEALNYEYLIKEYSVVVVGDSLSLTFSPSSNYTDSFAFVNGIEVLSMPDLYDNADGPTLVGGGLSFPIDNSTALEGLYRLNVGGNFIPPTQDTGLYRSWSDDTPYIFGAAGGTTSVIDPELNVTYKSLPEYTAPVDVYSTARFMTMDNKVNVNFNLSWVFAVDTGFTYLVRLHFCEIFANISKPNQVVFNIYLNNQTAFNAYDIIPLKMAMGFLMFRILW